MIYLDFGVILHSVLCKFGFRREFFASPATAIFHLLINRHRVHFDRANIIDAVEYAARKGVAVSCSMGVVKDREKVRYG